MSLKETIASHLPYLRRHARALTGAQSSGDAYVRATLEAILQGQPALADDLPPRTALYRVFHAIWASGTENVRRREHESVAAPDALSPEDRLMRLSPFSREALLLSALDGFSFHEIGAILDITAAEAERLAADAQAEMERELETTVLIIEDEAMIALDIKELTEELGHNVVAIARTRQEAVRLALQHRPGLVLADIQLADDSSGVDAVADILRDIDAPVIFVTAFPERLLTGERPEPTYLLTKPFDRTALKATIGQALFFHRGRAEAA